MAGQRQPGRGNRQRGQRCGARGTGHAYHVAAPPPGGGGGGRTVDRGGRRRGPRRSGAFGGAARPAPGASGPPLRTFTLGTTCSWDSPCYSPRAVLNWLHNIMSRDLAIDLGTANTLIYIRG